MLGKFESVFALGDKLHLDQILSVVRRQFLKQPVMWSALVLAFLFAITSLSINMIENEASLKQQGGSELEHGQTIVDEKTPLIEAAPSQVRTKADIKINSSFKNDQPSSQPAINLSVNNQEIPVPQVTGNTQTTTIQDSNGTVQVNVKTDLSESDNKSKTRIKINSESESEVDIKASF